MVIDNNTKDTLTVGELKKIKELQEKALNELYKAEDIEGYEPTSEISQAINILQKWGK